MLFLRPLFPIAQNKLLPIQWFQATPLIVPRVPISQKSGPSWAGFCNEGLLKLKERYWSGFMPSWSLGSLFKLIRLSAELASYASKMKAVHLLLASSGGHPQFPGIDGNPSPCSLLHNLISAPHSELQVNWWVISLWETCPFMFTKFCPD